MVRAGAVEESWSIAPNAPATVRIFPTLTGVALCISCIVLVEPAPVDALVLALFACGVVFGIVRAGQMPVLPVLFLAGLALANIISIPASEDPQRALWYCFVTLYMMMSWALFVGVMNFYGMSILRTMFRGYSLAACLSVILAVGSYFHIDWFSVYFAFEWKAQGTLQRSKRVRPLSDSDRCTGYQRVPSDREPACSMGHGCSGVIGDCAQLLAGVLDQLRCFARAVRAVGSAASFQGSGKPLVFSTASVRSYIAGHPGRRTRASNSIRKDDARHEAGTGRGAGL